MSALWTWLATHGPIVGRTLREHVQLSAAALTITLLIALPLGIGLARRPRALGPVTALVNTLRTIPSLALLAIMLPLLGTGFWPSLVALVLYGLPAVLINTALGVRDVDPDVIDAAHGQGLSDRQILGRVALPLAAPVILAGVRTAAVQIVSAATLAVFIGGGGLGELISSGMGLLDLPQLAAGAGLVALLAIGTEVSLGLLERGVAIRVGTRPA